MLLWLIIAFYNFFNSGTVAVNNVYKETAVLTFIFCCFMTSFEYIVNFGCPIHISGMAEARALKFFLQRETILSLAKRMTNHP